MCLLFFFVFKQKTAYEMRISDWSSDVCSSDLAGKLPGPPPSRPRVSPIFLAYRLTAQEPCVRLARKSTLLYAGYTARAGVATKVPWRSPTWLKVIPTEPVRSSERSKLLSAETLAVNRALNGRRAPVGANVAALTTPSVNFARLKLSQPLSLNPAPGRTVAENSPPLIRAFAALAV